MRATSKDNETGNRDEDKNDQFDGRDQIHQAQRPFVRDQTEEGQQGIRSKCKSFVGPFPSLIARGAVDVSSENDGVTTRERKGDCDEGIHRSEQKGGLGKSLFQIDDLTTGAVREQ